MSNTAIPESLSELQRFAGDKRNRPLIYPFGDGLDAERLITNPPNEKWANGIAQMWWGSRDSIASYAAPHVGAPKQEEVAAFIKLHDRLLSIGGHSVCFPGIEEDMANILKYGQLWYGDHPVMKKGRPSRCHQNSCDLWFTNKNVTRIATGYALSADGMWRQHSWLIWLKPRVNRIIETTEPRVAYYGFVMNTRLCEEFDENNL